MVVGHNNRRLKNHLQLSTGEDFLGPDLFPMLEWRSIQVAVHTQELVALLGALELHPELSGGHMLGVIEALDLLGLVEPVVVRWCGFLNRHGL